MCFAVSTGFTGVSILTRPEGRVQLARAPATASAAVSILTRPEGRVQLEPLHIVAVLFPFQSSPVPKDGCNPESELEYIEFPMVSILTRPEGRVQRGIAIQDLAFAPVSILTRPEGRVQRTRVPATHGNGGFNPHPSRRTGATKIPPEGGNGGEFQSSPVPKDGCNTPIS